MKRMGMVIGIAPERLADYKPQRWWTFTDPCQRPLASRAPGEHWAAMEEVFHVD
jgi:L-rhamnose mutarotase